MSTTCSLQIAYRRIAELVPDPDNPRHHSADQVKRLAKSIRALGFNAPVLTRGSRVLAGHARLEAAKALGLTEVPTIELAHLSAAQARAFVIADNRLAELADWDEQRLSTIFKELSEIVLDFEIEATGFATAEIDFRIGALDPPQTESADPAGRLPPPGPAVSRPDDLWLAGRHRILCGNALDPAAYAALMDGNEAAMVFTDPPYNVPVSGHVSQLNSQRRPDFIMAAGEMDSAAFTTFLSDALTLLARHSADGALTFISMDWRHMGELLAAGRVYSELKNLCVWVKPNAGMGSFYRSQHELIFVFKHGTAPHRNNIELGRFGRNRSNVWTYGLGGGEDGRRDAHPTPKPVAMVADAILDCTRRGDIVLDGFLGGGTTIIAAERTGRRGCGLELDPRYVDTAVRRWEVLTGEAARHAATGQSFADVAAERA